MQEKLGQAFDAAELYLSALRHGIQHDSADSHDITDQDQDDNDEIFGRGLK